MLCDVCMDGLTIHELRNIINTLIDNDIHAVVGTVFLGDFVFGDCFRHLHNDLIDGKVDTGLFDVGVRGCRGSKLGRGEIGAIGEERKSLSEEMAGGGGLWKTSIRFEKLRLLQENAREDATATKV